MIGRDGELTCEQHSELVSRNRDHGGVRGAWLGSLCLEFQLNHWLVDLPQFAGAQGVVYSPWNRLQPSHWNALQSRFSGCFGQQPRSDGRAHHQQVSSSLFEEGQTNRNTYISGSSLVVCLAAPSACLRMICRVPSCVLKGRVCVINSQDLFLE